MFPRKGTELPVHIQWFRSRSFRLEPPRNQVGQGVQGLFRIGSHSRESQLRAAGCLKEHDLHWTLSIHGLRALSDRDLRLKSIGQIDELHDGSRVQALLVHDCDNFADLFVLGHLVSNSTVIHTEFVSRSSCHRDYQNPDPSADTRLRRFRLRPDYAPMISSASSIKSAIFSAVSACRRNRRKWSFCKCLKMLVIAAK